MTLRSMMRPSAFSFLLWAFAASAQCPSDEGASMLQQSTHRTRYDLGKSDFFMPPNNNCCDSQANNPEECKVLAASQFKNLNGKLVMMCPWDVQTSAPPGWENVGEGEQSCSFDNCVGGIGADCVGVPYDLSFGTMGTLSVNLAAPEGRGNGKVRLKTAVGSILHDLCCIEHRHGAFCESSNYPIDATINLLGNADNNCACLQEWRKAAWNLIRGRWWWAEFDASPQSSDMTYTPHVVRKSWLPTGSGTNYVGPSNWGLIERQATARLCAPADTWLDCPSEDNNCKVPCIGISCTAVSSNRRRAQRKRWNKHGRNHAEAGDSQFCCSKEFKAVRWTPSSRKGKCA